MIDHPTFWAFACRPRICALDPRDFAPPLRFRSVRWFQLCRLCLASGRDADALCDKRFRSAPRDQFSGAGTQHRKVDE
jgi:hypothetical protein